MRLSARGWLATVRHRPAIATLIAVSLLASVLPATASPVVTGSTTGVRILTVPAPRVVVEFEGQKFAVDALYNPTVLVEDQIALTDVLSTTFEGLIWPGIGHPQLLADSAPPGWVSIQVTAGNSSGEMVGSYVLGSEGRGFVRSASGQFADVGEPPGLVAGGGARITVAAIAETGWIAGSFQADPNVCGSPSSIRCGFLGVPNGSGYDFTVFEELFNPEDIEYVTPPVGLAEHMIVAAQGKVWTQVADTILPLDDGGIGGIPFPVDVNQSGEIVGGIAPLPPAILPAAVYWKSPTAAPTVISPGDQATAINNDGTVVGWAGGTAYYWNPGDETTTDLGHLSKDAPQSNAVSINDTGQVLGTSSGRAVIWDLSGTYDINYPPDIFTNPEGTTVLEGQTLTFFPEFGDFDGDDLEASWTDLPADAVVDPQTKEITWQTAEGDAGTYIATLTVTEVDEPANTASAEVPLKVEVLQSGEYSSTGLWVHTIPTKPYPGAPSLLPEHINDNGWVVFGPSGDSLNSWWDGTGYPSTDIGCDNCSSFTIEDINNDNSMAGSYVGIDGQTRGYVWTEQSGLTDVGDPPNFLEGTPGSRIQVLGIDDQGRIAGDFTSADWCPGSEHEGQTPPTTGVPCMFIAVPPLGGSSYTFVVLPSLAPSLENHPDPESLGGARFGVVDVQNGLVLGLNWIWSAPTEGELPATRYQMLNTTGGVGALAFDINASAEVAGWLERNDQDFTVAPAYWATAASNPEQALLPGDTNGSASGINDAGWIVGHSEPTRLSFDGTAVLYRPAGNELVDLGRIGPTHSFAVDVNNTGLIAGFAGGEAVIWDLDEDYAVNYPPEVIDPDNFREVGIAGEELHYSPLIRDPEGDPFEVTWLNLPQGAVPSGKSGVRWQTGPGDKGVYEITMVVEQAGELMFSVDVHLYVYQGDVELPVEYTGVVWDDFDGNGQLDSPLEEPLVDVWVYLDLNGDGLPGVGEPLAQTDLFGNYSLTTDAFEPITVRQIAPDGYHQTSPIDGWVRDPLDGNVAGLDFGNQPDAGGDLDGDLIENSIDVVHDPLTYLHLNFSAFFDDSIASGGVTSGHIVNYGGLEVSVGDNPSPLGVVINATGSELDFAEVAHCGFTSRHWGGTVAAVTCGSLQVDVDAGRVTTLTADGAEVDVLAGSSVVVDDDDTNVTIEVVTGTATVTVGDEVIELAEGEVLENPGELGDNDEDGLTGAEEALTGTDPANPDTDGDGLIDGLDASWLIGYLDQLPNEDFKRRWHRTAMKLNIIAAAVAVNLGDGDTALQITALLHKRIDGCGTEPDRSDWITDCESQVGFRELLTLYERGIATLPLPDPFQWE